NQDALQAVLEKIANTFRDVISRTTATSRVPIYETNLVCIELLFGIKEEDSFKWVELFDRAANTNNWTPRKKIKIASGYLQVQEAFEKSQSRTLVAPTVYNVNVLRRFKAKNSLVSNYNNKSEEKPQNNKKLEIDLDNLTHQVQKLTTALTLLMETVPRFYKEYEPEVEEEEAFVTSVAIINYILPKGPENDTLKDLRINQRKDIIPQALVALLVNVNSLQLVQQALVAPLQDLDEREAL
ncbi:33798_t:CDS:2, partial [Racocetra persica]